MTSAIISFTRTVIFQVAAVLLLPLIWGLDGVWASVIVSEGLSMVVSAILIVVHRKKYQYW